MVFADFLLGTTWKPGNDIYGIFPMHRSLSVLFVSYPVSWLLTIVMQVTCYLILKKRLFAQIGMSGK